jgi:hypothetical protein
VFALPGLTVYNKPSVPLIALAAVADEDSFLIVLNTCLRFGKACLILAIMFLSL